MSSNKSFSSELRKGVSESRDKDGNYLHDLNIRLICPDCRDPVPDIREEYSSGDLVCGQCGLVLGDRIVDTRNEWRTFEDEGDPSRVGAAIDPFIESSRDLETTISNYDGGSGLSKVLQRAASRAATTSLSDGLLDKGFRQISTWCEGLSLPKSIQDIAKHLFKRSEEEKLLRVREFNAIIATCIFIACRQEKVPRTFREICMHTKVPMRSLGSCFKAFEQVFNSAAQSDQIDSESIAGVKTNRPEDLLSRFINHLDLPANFQPVCESIIKEARNKSIATHRNPTSICGGTILFTSRLLGQPIQAKEIAEVAGISEVTVKQVFRAYIEHKNEIVNTKLIETRKIDLSKLLY